MGMTLHVHISHLFFLCVGLQKRLVQIKIHLLAFSLFSFDWLWLGFLSLA